MLYYAAVFFVVALLTALLGMGGLALGAAGVVHALFIAFLGLAVGSLLIGLLRRH